LLVGPTRVLFSKTKDARVRFGEPKDFNGSSKYFWLSLMRKSPRQI
jgi:hypothetical protein